MLEWLAKARPTLAMFEFDLCPGCYRTGGAGCIADVVQRNARWIYRHADLPGVSASDRQFADCFEVNCLQVQDLDTLIGFVRVNTSRLPSTLGIDRPRCQAPTTVTGDSIGNVASKVDFIGECSCFSWINEGRIGHLG